MKLPEAFLQNMKNMLGKEFSDYMDCMERPSHAALRVNTLKISPERFREICPFALKDIFWTRKGFYYDASNDVPARHPYYYAGMYYIQEPSAMIPASILPVTEGDRVLDLCAAPGGKATELAAKLNGTGMLVANDISVSRAMALAKNLQMAGVRNAVVTAETPAHLAQSLGKFFDKILIDAPCSGEGMFRRDPHMVKDWLERGPQYYAGIQREILEEAWNLLKPGGMMVYSTCTFSTMEDEGMIQRFLADHSDMHICPVERSEGFSPGMPELVDGMPELRECVRIFPHRAEGEGHFAVLLKKEGTAETELSVSESPAKTMAGKKRRGGKTKDFGDFHRENTDNSMEKFLGEIEGLEGEPCRHRDMFFLPASDRQKLSGLRTVFNGLILGEQKKNRFEPGPQLALAIRKEDYPRTVDFSAKDIQVMKYLKGETVEADCLYRGYILFCVDGFPLGWCKGNGHGNLKNKYYPGWRLV